MAPRGAATEGKKMEKQIYKVGDKVEVAAGIIGSVIRICTGQLQGMIDVRTPGGVMCTDVLDVDPVK